MDAVDGICFAESNCDLPWLPGLRGVGQSGRWRREKLGRSKAEQRSSQKDTLHPTLHCDEHSQKMEVKQMVIDCDFI